ncbi:MAG: hypothetical protein ACP5TO_03140 [Thermoplasmata archaeon]
MQFIASGILEQSALFISIFYGLNIVWYRESGLFSKLLISPAILFTIAFRKISCCRYQGIDSSASNTDYNYCNEHPTG